MKREFTLFGRINKPGKYEIDQTTSLLDIYSNFAEGLVNNKRLSMVQVGGPFGNLALVEDIKKPLSDFTNNIDAETILFLTDLTCPVDYSRFCVRYLTRELRTTNETIEEISEIIEKIASGKSKRISELIILRELLEETSVIPAEIKMKRTVLFLLNNFEATFKDHILEKKCKTGICHRLAKAQCVNACPAKVNIPGYIAYMAKDDMTNAYTLMRQSNPLSFVCGLICARPCESRCRRGELEQTVGVRALKYYASTMALQENKIKEDKLESKNKKIAIVGSGPAGLSSAYYMARSGYDVTIYEAEKVVGGVPAMMIPNYRINNESINREVQLIKDLDVEIKTNIKVGVDIKLSEIRKNHDITILATGLMIGNKIGSNKPYITSAIDLLKDIKLNNKKDFPKTAIVVGGGDVTMDVARSLKRHGCDVTVLCRNKFDEMPASLEEKHGAVEEGIKFICEAGIDEYILDENSKDKDKLRKVSIKKYISTKNNLYAFNPNFTDEKAIEIDAELVVMAIGQKPDYSYLDEDIKVGENRWIEFDRDTYKTTANDVYLAGDMGGISKIAISAIAEGRKVAYAIDERLGGNGVYVGEELVIPSTPLNLNTWEISKQEEKETCSSSRSCNFDNVKILYSKEEALREANRCMRCDRNSNQ